MSQDSPCLNEDRMHPLCTRKRDQTRYSPGEKARCYCFPVHSPLGGLGPPLSAMLNRLWTVIRNALSATIAPIEKAMYEFLWNRSMR
mmetsp:Transcript_26807/g.60160  ORF Transcript_26807/g.60160 Transcript_26807/m.60160 type:complete len:87 (-) Transcript_26807:1506-1766(-)